MWYIITSFYLFTLDTVYYANKHNDSAKSLPSLDPDIKKRGEVNSLCIR